MMSLRDVILVAVGAVLLLAGWLTLSYLSNIDDQADQFSADEIASISNVSEFHEQFFLEYVARDPEWTTQLRLFGNNPDPTGDRLADMSMASQRENMRFAQAGLATLRGFDREAQTDKQRLTTDILDWYLDDIVRGEPFQFHAYPVNQLFGVQNDLFMFMTDIHSVHTRLDAENYVRRLSNVKTKFDQVLTLMKFQELQGIIPPKIVVQKVLGGLQAGETEFSNGRLI